MKQEGLIDNVVKAIGLDNSTVNGKATPAFGGFSYISAVGMLLSLDPHSKILYMLLTVSPTTCSFQEIPMS